MCTPLNLFSNFQLSQKEKEIIGTHKQNLAYQPTKSEFFILQVAKQSGIITQDTTAKAGLNEIAKKKNKVHQISLSDINMDEEKFKVLTSYFPRIYVVKAENARLNNTPICTAVEVQQYFPRLRNVTVFGLEQNKADFFDLIYNAPKK